MTITERRDMFREADRAASWANPLSSRERAVLARMLASAVHRFGDAGTTAPNGRRATCRQVNHAQMDASNECGALRLDVTERAEVATS